MLPLALVLGCGQAPHVHHALAFTGVCAADHLCSASALSLGQMSIVLSVLVRMAAHVMGLTVFALVMALGVGRIAVSVVTARIQAPATLTVLVSVLVIGVETIVPVVHATRQKASFAMTLVAVSRV